MRKNQIKRASDERLEERLRYLNGEEAYIELTHAEYTYETEWSDIERELGDRATRKMIAARGF